MNLWILRCFFPCSCRCLSRLTRTYLRLWYRFFLCCGFPKCCRLPIFPCFCRLSFLRLQSCYEIRCLIVTVKSSPKSCWKHYEMCCRMFRASCCLTGYVNRCMTGCRNDCWTENPSAILTANEKRCQNNYQKKNELFRQKRFVSWISYDLSRPIHSASMKFLPMNRSFEMFRCLFRQNEMYRPNIRSSEMFRIRQKQKHRLPDCAKDFRKYSPRFRWLLRIRWNWKCCVMFPLLKMPFCRVMYCPMYLAKAKSYSKSFLRGLTKLPANWIQRCFRKNCNSVLAKNCPMFRKSCCWNCCSCHLIR